VLRAPAVEGLLQVWNDTLRCAVERLPQVERDGNLLAQRHVPVEDDACPGEEGVLAAALEVV